MVQGWVGLAANLRHGREVVDEMGRSKSKPVSSPVSRDGAARYLSNELRPLDEDEKCLYQRIVAKINNPAHDRLIGFAVCNLMSCDCCLVLWPWERAGGETSCSPLEETTGLQTRLLGGQ